MHDHLVIAEFILLGCLDYAIQGEHTSHGGIFKQQDMLKFGALFM